MPHAPDIVADQGDADPRNFSGVGTTDRSDYARLMMPYRQFELAAKCHANRVALYAPDGQVLTFEELEDLVRRMASGLLNLGLQVGEAVCASCGNHWLQLPLYLAVARIGALFMATSRYLTPAEIAYQLGQARPRIVVGPLDTTFEAILDAADSGPVPVFADEWAPVHIRFSSGTTGRPKMMVATQRAPATLSSYLARALHLTEQDRQLVVGPLAHAALHFAIPQLNAGGTVYMREAFDKETLWKECGELGITNVMVVPTMISSALDYPGEAPQLRCMTSLGASLARSLKERLLARFPSLGLYEMYGASEHGMVTCLLPHEQRTHPTSVGKARCGQEVRVCDDEGNDVPPGTIGNIHARGPMVISAYLGDVQPSPPLERLRAEGWLACGDLGSLDEDGYLYISDRRVDLIVSGGLNVYPAEVEAVLAQIPTIDQVVVVGLPNERWGQVVTAYFTGQADERHMRDHCRDQLATYKLPRAFHQVRELPLTSSGKLSRALVRDAVAAGRFPS
jgi:acyl-CoA synthetase (AMP-forming)/AMP-acid ligase II